MTINPEEFKIIYDADSTMMWWLNNNRIYHFTTTMPRYGIVFGVDDTEYFITKEEFDKFTNEDELKAFLLKQLKGISYELPADVVLNLADDKKNERKTNN